MVDVNLHPNENNQKRPEAWTQIYTFSQPGEHKVITCSVADKINAWFSAGHCDLIGLKLSSIDALLIQSVLRDRKPRQHVVLREI
jgi:hypothetical protein